MFVQEATVEEILNYNLSVKTNKQKKFIKFKMNAIFFVSFVTKIPLKYYYWYFWLKP